MSKRGNKTFEETANLFSIWLHKPRNENKDGDYLVDLRMQKFILDISEGKHVLSDFFLCPTFIENGFRNDVSTLLLSSFLSDHIQIVNDWLIFLCLDRRKL